MSANTKDPRNRVTPEGRSISASKTRGLMMGNRGTLRPSHYGKAQPAAPGKNWIACVIKDEEGNPILENPERPVKYTKLFFLDEVTAFAAGHRPCGGCQRKRYEEFVTAWSAANDKPGTLMDNTIRDECVSQEAGGQKAVVVQRLADLPGGTMVRLPPNGAPHLWLSGKLLPWSVSGYGAPSEFPVPEEVEVITPMSIVRVFQAGFPLDKDHSIHQSALEHVA